MNNPSTRSAPGAACIRPNSTVPNTTSSRPDTAARTRAHTRWKTVAGLTPAQASWTDKSGNHSVGQLANHLVFWDRESLAKFKGETPAKFSGNNDETFNSFDAKQWDATVKQLDQVLTDWEKAVESADDKKLAEWASTIAHIGAHNAYHIGQIIYVRKEQGSWDPSKGVK